MIGTVIRKNLADIHECVAAACAKSGRDPAQVQLVAVTKYAEWEWVRSLAEFHRVFGENRPQQLVERSRLLPDVQWHLIGQLQRNKVRHTITQTHLIHSVDSTKLLQRIADVSAELAVRPQVLLQVNVSEEGTKSGFAMDELRQAWPSILAWTDHVAITGLMTMAPADPDAETARPVFRRLAEFRAELADRCDSRSANLALPELSMGMSNDFEVAVEEGATLVRIGSRLFEGL
ncbi:MAG: YggS family pyridoxal phosphate-dependent enzyme [Planctomycetaceae bacterium]